ncbi:glycosyltransferase [Verrucomicrobiaceae bacterium N1E253]|uniref:Glycosyltransferase n=1 Tax=Oceaniferula marina TaxID=2748318 RepID=A0A851GP52_9BACT|nr:glycosyltransferase [Oceaniferula marina]NWK56807.1 glycosyltransferase [Oceaniferula marina]
MSETPKISCIISTYSDSDLVEKKIHEIRQQSWFDQAEFLFVETASPERERELIAPYTEQFSNIRLVTSDERKTLYEAWNMGWDAASADIVCYSNMDDAMHPRLLETVVAEMDAHPDWDLCSVLIASQKSQSPGEPDSFSPERMKQLKIGRRPGPFSAWRKRLQGKMGQFDGRYRIIGDKDFWSRAMDPAVVVGVIPKVMYLYSIADSQLSKRENKDDELLYAKEKGVDLLWHPGVVKPMLWHRRWFKWFPGRYLMDE